MLGQQSSEWGELQRELRDQLQAAQRQLYEATAEIPSLREDSKKLKMSYAESEASLRDQLSRVQEQTQQQTEEPTQ